MGKFQELKVWQKAKDLAVYLYKLTMKGAFFKDYGLWFANRVGPK